MRSPFDFSGGGGSGPPPPGSVTNAMLAAMAALTVKANPTNASGQPQDVAASTNGYFFGRQANALGFFALGPTDFQFTTAPRLSGRTTAGAGAGEEILVDATLTLSALTLGRAATTGDVVIPAASNAATIQANAVGNTKLTDMVALTVKANATNATADPADVAATADGQFFGRRSTALGWFVPGPGDITFTTAPRLLGRTTAGGGVGEEISVNTTLTLTGLTLGRAATTGDVVIAAGSNAAVIQADVVLNTMLANMAQSTIKGRAAGAGTGDPTDLTSAQATAILDVMTGAASTGLKGLVPAQTSGDAAKVLSGAGTWVTATAGREVLNANRTYYVATTGSNSNDGLTVGTPFLTIQKALDVCATIDFGGFIVTIQLADGTYNAGGVVPVCVGQAGVAFLVVKGNATTPANVVVNAGTCFQLGFGTAVTLKDMRFTGGTYGIRASANSNFAWGNIEFNTITVALYALQGATGSCIGNYAITGVQSYHFYLEFGGVIQSQGFTCTITGTPAFTIFANSLSDSVLNSTTTYSGAATGQRWNVDFAAGINVQGLGTSYLPGSTAGVTTSPGWFA